YLFDPTTGWKNLNDLLGPDSNWDLQVATAIDHTGHYIVGNGLYYGRELAYRLDLVTGELTNLGDFTGYPYIDPGYIAGSYRTATAVNANGDVVGYFGATNALGDHAFIYTDATG